MMSWRNTLKLLKKSYFNNNCIPINRVIQQNIRTATIISVSQSQKVKDEFQDVLPGILDTIKNDKKFKEVPQVGEWVKKMLIYNLSGGKNNRGLTTVFAYEMLEKPENITEEQLRLARILGWCVEMLQAYLLVVDDIMDGASTRRGVPCWYRVPEVGLGALNDSILIMCSINQVLKTFLRDKPYYMNVSELFNEILTYTSIGQHLDFGMAHRNKNDYSMFTLEHYLDIVKYKSSFYTYQLPVSLGLYLTNNTSNEAHERVSQLCVEIGQMFQIQDDYLDCFGDESQTGKASTDIEEGKCTWFAVNAIARCTSAQRVVFESCYGSKEPAHIERIKRLYEQMELDKLYKSEETKRYNDITAKINELPAELSPALFTKLIDMIYKRRA